MWRLPPFMFRVTLLSPLTGVWFSPSYLLVGGHTQVGDSLCVWSPNSCCRGRERGSRVAQGLGWGSGAVEGVFMGRIFLSNVNNSQVARAGGRPDY